MNVERANQIIDSPEKIKVTYQGTPVWIESIDDGNQTARVFPENNPNEEKTVPVGELVEE